MFACLLEYKGHECALNLCWLAQSCIAFVAGAGGRRRKHGLGHVEAHLRMSGSQAGATFYLFVRYGDAGSGVVFGNGKRKQGQLCMLCSGALSVSACNHLGTG